MRHFCVYLEDGQEILVAAEVYFCEEDGSLLFGRGNVSDAKACAVFRSGSWKYFIEKASDEKPS